MADVYSNCGCGTNCGDAQDVRVVAGNDLTVEALVSVYDRDSGVYKPLDLSGATDVALRLVGTFSKVPGRDTTATGSRVSAFFPGGSVGVGIYGVEITFVDSLGKGRIFERNLIGIVSASGEATVDNDTEGETGEGMNVSVNVLTRTVRIGGTGATDYPSLTGKPSINGVVLEGNRTPEELGIAPSHIITSETLEVLMAIATSLKQADEIEISEDSFRKLEALPEVAFVNLCSGYTVLLGAGPIVKGKVDTFTVITGLSCLSPDKCYDFAYTAVDGKYIAGRFAGSVPKSIYLDANADGTMTSSLPLEQALSTSGGYSFPAFIVRLKNNSRYYRYYPARDIQVVTQEYGDIPTRAYLSINGVYYKWEEDILTPIMSTIGKTPVIYDLRLEATGGNLTIDDNGFGNSIIIDEIDFKARNPDKSTLIVRVSTYDKRSILFTSFKQGSDGVITSVSLYGYDPEDGRVNGAVLSITPDKTISLKEELAYIPSGETYTKVDADEKFETKEKAASDLQAVTGAIGGKVDKEPGKGLSKNDYTDEDKAKVRKALQEETDPTVPGWAKAPTKPAYTAKEVGALPDTTKIPTKVSELENDKNYLTEQSLEGYAKAADLSKVATSGKYEDLSGKPTILTESEVRAMINTAVVSAINTEV